jgi:hypothetical protein
MASLKQGALIVRATLPNGVDTDATFDALVRIEEELAVAIALAGAGELDGAELGQAELVLYMYGPDAERLFIAVQPVLCKAHLTQRAIVTIRLGPPGSASREVSLGD